MSRTEQTDGDASLRLQGGAVTVQLLKLPHSKRIKQTQLFKAPQSPRHF